MKTSFTSTLNFYSFQEFRTLLHFFLKRHVSLRFKAVGLSILLIFGMSNLLLAGTGMIGDLVWNDADQNGVQNIGEAGIADVNVDLEIYNGPVSPSPTDLANPANWIVLASTTTSSSGWYNFTGLEAAYYRVKFGLVAGYLFTTPRVGSGRFPFVNDSDAGTDGYSNAFFLSAGMSNQTYDAGMYLNPMPVKLASFNVNKSENNSAVLNWTTTEEVNSDYFIIEQSTDARSWVELAKVLSNGNHTGLAKYQYKDQLPHNGSNYYRLKMVDTDGSFAYSTIKEISIENVAGATRVVTYPNPVSEQLFLKTSPLNTITGVTIFSLSGKAVLVAKPSQITSGIEVGSLPEGIYVVKVKLDSGITESQKVFIAR